jgi:hypothetical protein
MSRERDAGSNRRWLDWNPSSAILGDSPQTEPTKPTERGFEGFVGLCPASSHNSERPNEIEPLERTLADSTEGITPTAPSSPANPIASALDSATREERVMSWSEWKAAHLTGFSWSRASPGKPGYR